MEAHSKKLDKVLNSSFSNLSEKNNSSSQVGESAAVYNDSLLDNPMRVVDVINTGIPYKVFKLINKQTPYTDDNWAGFMNISKRSLARFKASRNHIFKPTHSEKIFEIVEVTKLGYAVFDEPDTFYDWLSTPCLALGSHKPIALLSSSYGKELVVSELHSIDHGIFV